MARAVRLWGRLNRTRIQNHFGNDFRGTLFFLLFPHLSTYSIRSRWVSTSAAVILPRQFPLDWHLIHFLSMVKKTQLIIFCCRWRPLPNIGCAHWMKNISQTINYLVRNEFVVMLSFAKGQYLQNNQYIGCGRSSSWSSFAQKLSSGFCYQKKKKLIQV